MNEKQMNEAVGSFARECVAKYNGGALVLETNREDGSERWVWLKNETSEIVLAILEI